MYIWWGDIVWYIHIYICYGIDIDVWLNIYGYKEKVCASKFYSDDWDLSVVSFVGTIPGTLHVTTQLS